MGGGTPWDPRGEANPSRPLHPLSRPEGVVLLLRWKQRSITECCRTAQPIAEQSIPLQNRASHCRTEHPTAEQNTSRCRGAMHALPCALQGQSSFAAKSCWVQGVGGGDTVGCTGPISPCSPSFCGCICRRSRSRGDNVGALGINGNCRTGLQAAGMQTPYLFLIAHTWIKGVLQSKL